MNNNYLINNFARLTQSPENVAELKKLVLQLAVQGKLTENWRAENKDLIKETGTDLLEKIKTEKEELIKSGKLKRQKPLPEIEKDEIPFDIPDSWVWTRLQDKSKLVTDGTHYTPKYKPSGRIFLSAQNIKPFRFIPKKHRFVSEEDYQGYIKNKVAEKNDILIARVGAGIGECAKIDKDIEFAFYVSLALVKPFTEYSNSSFIEIYINSPFGYSYSKGNISGISAGNFNLGDIRKMPFPFPPLAEQEAIVSIVESLFLKIDQLHEKSKKKQELQQKTTETLLKRINSQNANLQEDWQLLQNNFSTLINQKQAVKQLRKTILQLAVQGKLTENWRAENKDLIKETGTDLLEKIKTEKEKLIKSGKLKRQKPLPEIEENEKPFEIPKSWVWVRLGKIAQHNSGKTLHKSKNTGKSREYITTSNLYWGFFKVETLKTMLIEERELEKCQAKKGDLLICEGGEAGRAAVWGNDDKICFQNHIHRVRPFVNINSYFIFRYFQKLDLTGEINNYRTGMGISNISGKALASIILPLPSLAEQKAIVSQVEKLLKMCDNLEQKITESENLNKKLMQTIVKEYT